MIGKAKAIQHELKYLRYEMGESKSKKHPEKIDFICTQHLPPGLDAQGVLESMMLSTEGHGQMKNHLIRIELSPSKEHTKDFAIKDWQKLWDEFVEEFDKQVIVDDDGNVASDKTNIAGSKAVVYLHKESKGEIPHLHGAVCRVDENGHTNNDHEIHLRAQRAAEAVALRRGWITAMGVRNENIEHISALCENVLRDMPRWSWEDYVARIEHAGNGNLKVMAHEDCNGNITGYCIINAKAKYKSSELGKGRKLTYSRLAATWQKMHPVTKTIFIPKPDEPPTIKPAANQTFVQPKTAQSPAPTPYSPTQTDKHDYTNWTPDRSPVDIETEGKKYHLYLPKSVLSFFDDEFDYREVFNWEALTNLSCAYFAVLLVPSTPAETGSGGGGSTSDSKWGREKDEDDMRFAHRCAIMAKNALGVRKRNGRRR